MRNIFGCFIFLMIAMTSLIFAGTVYYVDATNGNDLNDGLFEVSAWKTISKVNGSSFNAGDTIKLKRGETWNEDLIFPSSGSDGNPITIEDYGSGALPMLYELSITTKSYITVNNISIKSVDDAGLEIDYSNNIIIDGCYIDGNNYADRAVIFAGNSGTNTYDCIIRNCEILNAGGTTQNLEFDGYTHDILVEDNVVHDCNENDIQIYAGTEAGGSYNITIRGNECYGSAHGIGLSWYAHDCIVENNIVHDTSKSGISLETKTSGTNNTVRYNIVYNTAGAGWEGCYLITDGTKDCTWYNNVAHSVTAQNTGIWMTSAAGTGNVFKNNIVAVTGWALRIETDADFSESDYNCFWETDGTFIVSYHGSNYTTLADYQSASSQDANSIISDPLFVDAANGNFTLKIGSLCIDAGTFVGLTEDYAGHTVPYGWGVDIGAYEYTGASSLDAEINASPNSGWAPLIVNFSGSASGGTEPYTYSWDFGDGASSSEQNPTHTYSNAGDYTVNLTVTDSQSNQDNDSLIINTSAPTTSLEASFIASPTSGWVPLTINFIGSATGGTEPYSYSWDFGDSTSSSEQNPTHTYSDAGDYTVTFTVTDSQSNQDNDSLIINASTATNSAYLSCSPTSLYFGANTSGNETADQYLRIINAGGGSLTWNIEDTADWLSCSPSSGTDRGEITVSVNASGLPQGLYMATIIVSSPQAYNSPQYVSVNLRVYESGQESSPFGSFDTLVDGSTVSGSVPVTGWALDDIEATRVEIKRNSDPEDPSEAIGSDGLVYLGDAFFVEGARPDVEKSYPDYPLNSRAGWGYMLLTNSLPNRGNGFFTIYVFAYDASGNRVEIARKNIFCDNTNSVKPFGTIDTPEQGESIGGSDYINFGWALTPLPKTIPKDGSTIWVWMDGVQMGEPVYNQYWEDIATLYPEYNNAQGSVGYYYLDTTQYENGVHTISWSVMDDGGEVDGIGARYFSIDNIETGNAHPGPFVFKRVYQEDAEGRLRIGIKEVRRGYRLRADNESEINKKAVLETQPEEMNTRRRYRLRADDRRDINIEDILKIQIEEMEPIRIVFEGSSEGNMKYIGWGENKANVLPIGSTLDREKGIFSWIPTPGFIGRYVLYFAVTDGSYMSKPLRVIVNVIPKSYD